MISKSPFYELEVFQGGTIMNSCFGKLVEALLLTTRILEVQTNTVETRY
jgi:hypothetical protein